MNKQFNRKTVKFLAATSLAVAFFASAAALQAQDSAKKPHGMMMQGGNMGMMGMMSQMNRMMGNCNRMMERAMNDKKDKTPGKTTPKAPAEK